MIQQPVPASIFRAYDIRGIVPTTLNESIVYQIAQAYGTQAKSQGYHQVVIGRDGRISGPALLKALSEGLMSVGCHVINIGAVPTPVLYHTAIEQAQATGVMLTGSHNPKDYNGLKMTIGGQTLANETIQALYQRIVDQAIDSPSQTGEQQINSQAIDAYIDAVKRSIHLKKSLKVVIDAGNGIAGSVAPKLFQALGCDVVEQFCHVDGTFPNHHPDPSKPENLESLKQAVAQHHADIGLAFDGDADRLGVVTPQGEIIYPDRQLMLFAQQVLRHQPGSTILYDVKCSKAVADFVKAHGGVPLMYQTGHALIKQKMKTTPIALAGEMSGHIFFNDRWPGFDDGMYVGARLVEILSEQANDADAVFAKIPNLLSTPELSIEVADEVKFDVMDALGQQAPDKYPEADIITIDGLRVEFSEGWALVRASNTTPKLVFRFEADSADKLHSIQSDFMEWVQAMADQYQ